MASKEPRVSSEFARDNDAWFGRDDAFAFLERDRDNVVRIEEVERILSRGRRGTLLDLGCGDGRIGERLQRLGYQVTGLDVSGAALDHARRRGLGTIVGDVSEALPIESASFDAVFAGEVIEHLFAPDAFLAEVFRVLRPGGRVVLTTPNLAHLPDRLRLLAGRAPTQVQPLHPFLRLHIRPFTAGTLRDALRGAGFEAPRLRSSLVVFRRDSADPDQVRLASRWLARVAPSLGSFLIAESKKP
ncbi:MAG: methyltransferase domain-containing protein [Polyangiaceae bacterium]